MNSLFSVKIHSSNQQTLKLGKESSTFDRKTVLHRKLVSDVSSDVGTWVITSDVDG